MIIGGRFPVGLKSSDSETHVLPTPHSTVPWGVCSTFSVKGRAIKALKIHLMTLKSSSEKLSNVSSVTVALLSLREQQPHNSSLPFESCLSYVTPMGITDNQPEIM